MMHVGRLFGHSKAVLLSTIAASTAGAYSLRQHESQNDAVPSSTVVVPFNSDSAVTLPAQIFDPRTGKLSRSKSTDSLASDVASDAGSTSSSSIIEGSHFQASALSGSHFQTSAYSSPNSEEAETAMEVASQYPEVERVLANVPAERAEDFQQRVLDMVYDADFRYDVQRKLAARAAISKHSAIKRDEDPERARWNELKERHQCVFCQDVLSAPMLLRCTHSHCFHCLKSYASSCQPVGNDSTAASTAEVVLKCPTCTAEFRVEEATFERNLHEAISELVATFPLYLKEEWEERRQTYLDHKRRAEEEEQERKRQQLAAQARQAEAQSAREEQESWTKFCNKYVPVVAFFVLIIIGIARGR